MARRNAPDTTTPLRWRHAAVVGTGRSAPAIGERSRSVGVALVLASLVLASAVAGGLFTRWWLPPRPPAGAATPTIAVHFSPGGGCTAAIVVAVAQAKAEVLVQAYSFTSAPIAEALVEAHRRGVDVQVLLDESQKSERYTVADLLARAGIAVAYDTRAKIAHNKVMVIDQATVITGSFNFTRSAEEGNAENLLVIRDTALAARYAEHWRSRRVGAETYAGR